MITESAIVAIGGLIAVIALLFLMITRFKWHVFIALLVPIVLFALLPGIDRSAFITAFEQGFGARSRHRGRHSGRIHHCGSTQPYGWNRAHYVFDSGWVGEKRMPLALTMSGWIIGLAIFSDVGYVILNPLVHFCRAQSALNMSVMARPGWRDADDTRDGSAHAGPTGGRCAGRCRSGDCDRLRRTGTLIASLGGLGFALVAGPHIVSPPSEEFVGKSLIEQGRESELPSTWRAYAHSSFP